MRKFARIRSMRHLVDGVPVYEAFVELESAEKIKTGMSVSGTVVLATKDNVIAIPSYLIKKDGDKSVVEVKEEGGTTEKQIATGFTGTDNMVEVLSGLEEGDKIISV